MRNPLPQGSRSKGLRPVSRSGYTEKRKGCLAGQPSQMHPDGTRVGDKRHVRLSPTIPGCVKGFHSHPPCVGRPVGHRDRAGNAKPRAWRTTMKPEVCPVERRVKVPNEARWLSAWPRVDRHCRKAELRADAALTGCPRLIKARCRLTTAHR